VLRRIQLNLPFTNYGKVVASKHTLDTLCMT
jgi:hypothetical protein